MKYAMLSVPMKHNEVIILLNGTTGCSRGKHNRMFTGKTQQDTTY